MDHKDLKRLTENLAGTIILQRGQAVELVKEFGRNKTFMEMQRYDDFLVRMADERRVYVKKRYGGFWTEPLTEERYAEEIRNFKEAIHKGLR